MLRRIAILFFVGLLPTLAVFCGEIDDLKTLTDVNAFLKKTYAKDYDEIELDEKSPSKTTFGKNTFHKVDIDGDGATDLIVDGKYLFAVIDAGNQKYEFYPIDRGTFTLRRYTLRDISRVAGETVLTIEPTKARDDMPPTEPVVRMSLVRRYGGWFELNKRPDNLRIQRISFSTSGCYGTCPIFEITINADRNAKYNAKKFNKPDGTFTGTVTATEYDQLVKVINYLGISTLKNGYAVGWTDDQTATVTIVYNRGKKKTIRDYGMVGTFGLEALYNQFFALRENQKWTATK